MYHNSHQTIPISEKQRQVIRDLKSLYEACRKQSKEVESQLQVIAKDRLSIETSAELVIEKLEKQRDVMEMESMKLFEQQINSLEEVKREELKTFDTKTVALQRHDRDRKKLEDTAKRLLTMTQFPDFTTKAIAFLKHNKIKDILHMEWIENPEKIKINSEDRILRYFPIDEENRQHQEVSRKAQLRFPKGSVGSVGTEFSTQLSDKSRILCLLSQNKPASGEIPKRQRKPPSLLQFALGL